MPIGAYDPWIHAHCNPEQALAMANHVGAEFVLPVHHRTFKLSNEPYGEPIERLLRASGSAQDRIVVRVIYFSAPGSCFMGTRRNSLNRRTDPFIEIRAALLKVGTACGAQQSPVGKTNGKKWTQDRWDKFGLSTQEGIVQNGAWSVRDRA